MKAEIRTNILEKRRSLEKDEIMKRSARIKDCLFSLPEFRNAKTVMFYVSCGSEVFTKDMIQECLGEKEIVVPKVIGDEMVGCRINSMDDLFPGYCGVLEPKHYEEYDGRVDIVIVPGVAFDMKKDRIGLGKGFYDFFLMDKESLKIALAFDVQLVENVPIDSHDVRMDKIVTETRIIE